ncbi:protein translocase subunit SecD [Kocuria sp. p3-SID1433]|nr:MULTISPECIES: protein translocase subunit SecD [unclassified Kocuria]MCT1600774.1 protein translocase subunit SecD [Kocuria sp. p3-SID1428]MCT2179009.1 protein translocase subunit SecD [Kocuria sp. p3-SID1433]
MSTSPEDRSSASTPGREPGDRKKKPRRGEQETAAQRAQRRQVGGTELHRAVSTARGSLVAMFVLLVALFGVLSWGAGQGHTGWGPRLALDLEGGTQMILTPELTGQQEGDEISQEQLDQAVEIIRQRVDGSGVSEAEVSTQGGENIVVSMPGTPDQETRDLIQTSAQMSFRPVLMVGPAEATPEDQRTPEDEQIEPEAEPTDSSDPNWVDGDLMAQYEATDCTQPQTPEQRAAQDPEAAIVACDPAGGGKYILGPIELEGTDISDSSYGMAQGANGTTTGQYAVNIQFDDEGTQTFKELSERLNSIGQTSPGDPRNQFAILLDGEVISAPSMDAVIPDGQAQITGSFTEEEAAFLSEQLRYGSLPVSFEISSEQQISATMGADQLRWGVVAGLIGLALVAVYCLLQYRLLGLVTIASLVVLGVASWLAIVLLGWGMNYRLSMAGVAGLIVSIGMAADSFIVYFERIRDEIRIGRTIPAAIDHGWKRARQTVIASKTVNLIASVVLYFVAVGNVRGFAFTLGLTAVIDLVVVFLFTHPVMVLLSRTRFFAQGRKGSGLDPETLDAVPLYRGAGRTRTPDDLDPSAGAVAEEPAAQTAPAESELVGASSPLSSRPSGASAEPDDERGLTVAERRRRARREAGVSAPADPPPPQDPDATRPAADRRTNEEDA